MKKLFAIIFSFQLILSPVALAQDECKPGEDCYQITGDGSSEGAARYTNSIMMTGSGVVGASLIMVCTPKSFTFSHYIFMAGALVLLASEIVAATKAKEAKEESEKQMERMGLVGSKPGEYQTKEQKDAQLTLLVAAKGEEIKNRDALEDRMNWMTAVEVVYWLAVAGAAVEIILEVLPKGYDGGYLDGLDCKNEAANKLDKVWMGVIAGAYGLLPGLISGDIMGAGLQGVSAYGFTTALQSTTSTVGKTFRKIVNSCYGRTAVFGVFAALASIAKDGLKNSRDRANKNIAVIEKSIESWKKANTTSSQILTDVETEGDGANPAGANPSAVKPLPKAVKTTKCMGGNNSSMEYSSKACSKPLKFARTNVDFKSKYLNAMGGKAFDMAEAMASGNTEGAKMHAGDLASNAARVKSEAQLVLKQANDKLKAAGKKELDFDKEVKNQIAAFTKSAQDSIAAAGIKNLGSGSSEKDEGNKVEQAPEVTSVKGTGAVDIPAPTPDLSLGTGDTPVEETAAAAGPEQSLNDFETNEQDISKKSDVSLFKQLSNRYILNYTKIFDRKKDVEVIEEPKK